MISKLSKTDDLNMRLWAQETREEFNNYIQVLDIPVSKSGIIANYVKGKHAARYVTATAPDNKAYFEFIVPYSLSAFKEVTIRFIPTTSGSFNYTVNLAYGAVGTNHATSTKTVTASKSVTDALITEIDITSLFTDQQTSDQVGCEFVINTLTTTTVIDVLSLYIKYI